MKEMEYKNTVQRELLDRGIYKDHEYFVISFGTHPCADVKLNGEHKNLAEGVRCHGGVTYSENYLKISDTETIEGFIIGWDYAHYGDYVGYGEEWCAGEKYTTEEIVDDCKRVIDELTEE